MKRCLIRAAWSLILGLLAVVFSREAPAGQNDTPRELPFSTVMSELSNDPAFVDAFIKMLGQNPAAGGILGPEQLKRLRELILGKQFEELDRFPGLTVVELGRSITLADRALAPKDQPPPESAPPPRLGAEPLGIPTRRPPLGQDALLKPLGFGLTRGDLLDPKLSAMQGDSDRLAEILNRLALTPPQNDDVPGYTVTYAGKTYDTPDGLMAGLVANGHAIEVADARYFANFGHILFKGVDVVAPFWLDTRYEVPGTGRSLLVPVSHSQHEVRVRGPVVNADLAFYFGIDGKAQFRPIIELDQAWIMGRRAHSYNGATAIEAVRLAASVAQTFAAIQKVNPELPFGGYFTLGVCNDATAIIELAMTGAATLFPLTLDKSYFVDASEAAVLAQRLPIDGRGKGLPDMARILASVPAAHLADIPIPGLAADLRAAKAAWEQGTLREVRTPTLFEKFAGYAALLALGLVALASLPVVLFLRWRRRKAAARREA